MTEPSKPPLPKFPFDIKKILFLPKPSTPPVSVFGMELASFNRRLLAAALDILLLMFFLAPFSYRLADMLVGAVNLDHAALNALSESFLTPEEQGAERVRLYAESGFFRHWIAEFIIQMAVLMGYCLLCWRFWSATPGKLLLRMRIVDAQTGARISSGQSVKRAVFYLVSGACAMLGFFWIAFDKQRQGWHDKFAHTVVVAIAWRRQADDGKTV